MNVQDFNQIGQIMTGNSIMTVACGLQDTKQYLEFQIGENIITIKPNQLNLDIEFSKKDLLK